MNVEEAYFSENGRSIICIKSTATVEGRKVQIIVTEFGAADLYGVSDEERGAKLISLAHPDFRDTLSEEYEKIKRVFYKN